MRKGARIRIVSRVCDELRQSEAVQSGQLTREQAFDEIEERAAQCYRNIWTSCSEDEKVVLSHIAQHGLANASVRTVVRRLLGRRLLHKDPALRPMNETFRRFVLSKECWRQVTVLETAGGSERVGPSARAARGRRRGRRRVPVRDAEGALQRDPRRHHRRRGLGTDARPRQSACSRGGARAKGKT